MRVRFFTTERLPTKKIPFEVYSLAALLCAYSYILPDFTSNTDMFG